MTWLGSPTESNWSAVESGGAGVLRIRDLFEKARNRLLNRLIDRGLHTEIETIQLIIALKSQ